MCKQENQSTKHRQEKQYIQKDTVTQETKSHQEENIKQDIQNSLEERDLYNSQQEESNAFLKPRRLHPAGMFFGFIKVIKETILGLGIGSIAIFKQSPKYGLIFIGVFGLFTVVNSVLSWFRHTYRVEDGELRIEQGIIKRKKRFISLNRIHKIDITANVIHRIFRLGKVQIDTASSGAGAEVSLSAVKIEDAQLLRQVLKKGKQSKNVEEIDSPIDSAEETINPKRKITWKRLFIAGSTSGSVGVILLAMLFLFSQTGEFIPESVYDQTFEWIIQLSIVLIVILAILGIVFLWLAGIAGTMIKYGNFIIEKRETELFIKRGLLETKELTIPFDRIQAIQVEQSLIRQPFKFVKVSAIIAGGSFDSREAFPVLFPLMRKQEVEGFLQEFVPGYEHILTKVSPLAKKGRKYYLISASILFILALIPVLYFFPTFSWIPGLFVLISLGYGMLHFKESGYHIHGKNIIFQYRGVTNKKTMMTYHRRIQTVEKSRHKLQQLEGLASTKISLIGTAGLGTHFKLKHLENEAANEIGDWFSYRKNKENALFDNAETE